MTLASGEVNGEAGEPPAIPSSKWQQTAHGKGKVRPRKNQPLNAQADVPRLTAVAYMDAEHGEQEGDPRPRFPEHIVDGWVDYIHLDTAQNVYRAVNKLLDHQPALLRGTPLAAGLVGRWSFRHLARCVGTKSQMRVLCSDARRHRFFEFDDVKNVYGGPYHVREPETQRLDMTFPDFAQCAQQWSARRLHLRDTVMHYQRRPTQQQPSSGQAHPGAEAAAAASGKTWPEGRPCVVEGSVCGVGLADDLQGGIDWEWLSGLLRTQKHGPVLRVDLEAGSTGGLLPAAYECEDRLMLQVTGRRRVLLMGPGQAFDGLYPYPLHHTYDRYSMVDLEAPDAGLWPKFSGVRGVTAILSPGDVLFVPAYWFVHSQHLEAECVSLSCHLGQGARPPSPEGTQLRLSRALEQRVADVEGPNDVRHWLQLIGHGEEYEWINLGTVKGYRRIVFCQGVRDDVDCALGGNAWADLLPRMCEGRLVPTPWLNKDFREPLYLLDKPVVLEDTRTKDEKRYPELFRSKLRAEGWHVPEAVSTVPIPGVNMPKDADYRTYGMTAASS